MTNVISSLEDDKIQSWLCWRYGLMDQIATNSLYKEAPPQIGGPVSYNTNSFEVKDTDGAIVASIDRIGNITGNGVSLTTLKGQFDGSSNEWANMPAFHFASTGAWTTASTIFVPWDVTVASRNVTLATSNLTLGAVGWVTMNASVRINGTQTGQPRLVLYKNGSAFVVGPFNYVSSVVTPSAPFSATFYNTNTADIFSLQYTATSFGAPVTNGTSESVTWWTGVMSK